MSTDVSDITGIALVTLKVIHNTLLINELRLLFTCRELLGNLAASKHWLDISLEFFNCVFTILADSWSLKGITTQVVFSVVDLDHIKDWSATLKFRKVSIVESTIMFYVTCLKTYFRLSKSYAFKII